MNLWDYFKNKTGKTITKWTHYFWVYEKHFEKIRHEKLLILEIGVLNGGSLEMWREYFPNSVIVGIDINPDCIKHEQADKDIFVRIGDQSNSEFLQDLINEFGKFDLVIDDGSHHVAHVKKTFDYLYERISPDGIYFIEDTHAAYWSSHGGSLTAPDSINNVAKNCVDKINADHARGQISPDYFTKNTKCMSVYDSIVVFEKGDVGEKYALDSGPDFVRPEPEPASSSDGILIIRTDLL